MINIDDKDNIINTLAVLLSYGFSKNYSFDEIETLISNSNFINDLEHNKYIPMLNFKLIIEDTYKTSGVVKEDLNISFISIFFAESYINLFFSMRKSFEYLFLYWPLEYFENKYHIYHEMDYLNLETDFLLKSKSINLIKILSKKKNIKLIEVSKLTGININSIDRYSRNDDYLYNASNETLYKLSTLFNVKQNIFVKKLNVCFDKSSYFQHIEFIDIRNHLGLYFAKYMDKRLNDFNFIYNSEKNIFECAFPKSTLFVEASLQSLIDNKKIDKNTYIILFENENHPISFYNDLRNIDCLEIMIINKNAVYFIKKSKIKDIEDSINTLLNIKTMDELDLSYL